MQLAHQPSLLDAATAAPVLARPLAQARRTPLAGGAWVDHLPGWVGGSEAVLTTLLAAVAWRAEERPMYDRIVAVPRLLAWFGEHDALPHPLLDAARSRLSEHYGPDLGEPFSSAGMCLYRDGRDSVAWHGDRLGRGATSDTVVAILSLGSARALLLRPRAGGPRSVGQ